MSEIIFEKQNTSSILRNILDYFISKNQLQQDEAKVLYQNIIDEDNDEIKIKKVLYFIRRHSRYVEMIVNRENYLSVSKFENQLKGSFADLSLHYDEELIDYAFIDLAKINKKFFWTSLISFHYGISDYSIGKIVQSEVHTISTISQISYSFLVGYVASKRRDSLVNIIKDSNFKKINKELLIQEDQKSTFEYSLSKIENVINEQQDHISILNKKILKMTDLLTNKINI